MLVIALAEVLQVTGSLLLQITRWLKQHGDAVLDLDATFVRCAGLEATSDRTYSWLWYWHGVTELPALMPNLRHLSLTCEKNLMVAEQDLSSLQILTHLQTLRLNMASNGRWDYETMSPLQHLTALKRLDSWVKGLSTMFLAPGLGKLTLLTSLSLRQPWSFKSASTYDSERAGDVLGHLTSLQELTLQCLVDRIPPAFSHLQHLRTLTVSGVGEAWPAFSVQPSFSACRNLKYLRLFNFTAVAGAGWSEAWSALSALPALSDISLERVDLEALQGNGWAFGNILTLLSIVYCDLVEFPEALVSLTSLQSLSFDRTDLGNLSELPAGPYLEQLTSLDLSNTALASFPAALSQASKLKRLIAFEDPSWLGLDELEAILPDRCVLEVKA